MAFKTFADGVALPASDLNTYLMKQSVVVCTSSTRPASPVEGMAIYETDTDKLLIYTTATTTWQPPWNMPWGYMGSASQTTAQTGISDAYTDLTSLATTVTLVTNRRYRVTATVPFSQITTGATSAIKLLVGAESTAGAAITVSAGAYACYSLDVPLTGLTAGATTFKLQASTPAGTLSTNVSATQPATLYVEDIGPSTAPA